VTRQLFDRQADLWAYVRRTDSANEGLVIFVHGFRGSYLSTWGDLANFLTHHADDHDKLAKWDYLFVGYETYSVDTYLNIAKIVASQWAKASDCAPPFDQNKYRRLALFAHSLGTLGIRQLLCAVSEQPAGMTDALKATVLFGSPLNGSPLAGLAGIFKIVDTLKGKPAAALPGGFRIRHALKEGNPELEMLRIWCQTMRIHGKDKFGPIKVIQGTDDQVVGTGKLVSWDGDQVITTPKDHIQMVKITDAGAATYGTVLDELKGLP